MPDENEILTLNTLITQLNALKLKNKLSGDTPIRFRPPSVSTGSGIPITNIMIGKCRANNFIMPTQEELECMNGDQASEYFNSMRRPCIIMTGNRYNMPLSSEDSNGIGSYLGERELRIRQAEARQVERDFHAEGCFNTIQSYMAAERLRSEGLTMFRDYLQASTEEQPIPPPPPPTAGWLNMDWNRI